MSTNGADECVQLALRAAYQMIGDDKLQERLADPTMAESALQELGLPESARGPLLTISSKLSTISAGRISGSGQAADEAKSELANKQVQNILYESFVHMRWSFWSSLVMSVVLFVVGLALMVVATAQLLVNESLISGLAIGGLGLADFVLVFYKGPWRDIARNLSNSQQVRTIAISYLSSVALLNRGDSQAFESMQKLTQHTVAMLEKYAEPATDDKPGRTATPTS